MSPAWCAADCGPCGCPSGLKWPPVLIPSAEPQSPFSWTWKPCVAPGFKPITCATTWTPPPRCVKVTVPCAELPWVGSRLATALAPPPPIEAQPAAAIAAAAIHAQVFIAIPPGRPLALLRGGLLRVGLRLHLPALRRRGSGRGGDGLRDGLPHLPHVRLVVLDRRLLGGGLLLLRL